jgi:protein-disulfide isomerase
MEPTQPKTSSPAIPAAIIVGFAMVAIAVFFTGGDAPVPAPAPAEEQTAAVANSGPRPVDEDDYIRGNPNAPILFIEYSDYECPFCKDFHGVMRQIMEQYGANGQVGWVYRQFPLEQLHPNAPRISEAALCVGDLGGETAFWQFSDLIFEQREFDTFTNVVRLPEYAERAGVNNDEFNACMSSGRMRQAVIDSVEDGFNAGVRGTPLTYVVAGNQQAVISGTRSYETLDAIVSTLIDQLNRTSEAPATDPGLEGIEFTPTETTVSEVDPSE